MVECYSRVEKLVAAVGFRQSHMYGYAPSLPGVQAAVGGTGAQFLGGTAGWIRRVEDEHEELLAHNSKRQRAFSGGSQAVVKSK